MSRVVTSIIYIYLFFSLTAIAQNVEKPNCLISIRDYGAKMDGKSDDTQAIVKSLKELNYAFIPQGYEGARVEKTIILSENQSIYGSGRGSVIKSFVSTGAYTIRAEYVTFTASTTIKDLSIDIQTKGANGIQAFETRNVYIDNVAILGNHRCGVGIQLNGGSTNGSAWNQLTRYTITRCNLGIELTSDTKNNWCNRNYIGFGVVQSCKTGVRLYRSSTNTILACPQGCPTGFKLEKSRLNKIDTYLENSKTNAVVLDEKSNYNTITGQLRVNNYLDKGKSNILNLNRPKNQPVKLN